MPRQEVSLQDELESMRASRRMLDKQIAQKRGQILRSLHRQVDLPDMDSLLRELWKLASPEVRAELMQSGSEERRARPVSKSRGTRYDETVKAQVRYALEQRHLTPAQTRKEFGLSVATLAKWMKLWGISPPRRASARGEAAQQPASQTA